MTMGRLAEALLHPRQPPRVCGCGMMCVQCEHCLRTFLPEKLVIHQRSCRPGNTAKPVGAPTLGGAGAPNHPIRKGGGGRVRVKLTPPHLLRFAAAVGAVVDVFAPWLG
jgi:hypothetical protein